jgi:hypothetical protein
MSLQNYYYKVNDIALPSEVGSENIILTLDGMKELSNYYNEKYNIDIIPLAVKMGLDYENASSILCAAIDKIREQIKHQPIYRCGFVLHNIEAGNHGHAMPVIWEKSGDTEKLFFLDTGQFLGDASYDNRECDFIFKIDFSSSSDLNDLPGDSPTAYVLCNEGAIFIDKASNERVVIDHVDNELMIENLYQFSIENHIPNQHAFRLSETHLKKIRAITEFNINSCSQVPKMFRDNVASQMPNVQMWSHVGSRQLDQSSCTIDAMVTLKDGLRLSPNLSEQANHHFIQEKQGIHLFRMPEFLLKTAQISSFVSQKSQANMGKEMHVHHVKDMQGNKTGQNVVLTLQEFRDKHDVSSINRSGETKKFNTSTLQKGNKIAKILQRRWDRKHPDTIFLETDKQAPVFTSLHAEENNQTSIDYPISHEIPTTTPVESSLNPDTSSLNTEPLSKKKDPSPLKVSDHAFLSQKVHRKLEQKQQKADEKLNQPIFIRDIVVRTHPRFAGILETCVGEVNEQSQYRQPKEKRLTDHIASLFHLANEEHRANYCKQNADGSCSIKEGMENHITRLSTSEFSLYTDTPLVLSEFHTIIRKIETMAADLEPNVHILLSSFAVRDANDNLLNMVIFVEGGNPPILHAFSKNQASIADVDYGRRFIPFTQHEKRNEILHASFIATTEEKLSSISTGSVFEITTAGGATFTQAIDVCIDHAYGHSKNLIQKRIATDSVTSEIFPEQIEQCITSCGVHIDNDNIVAENILIVDPQVSLSEEKKNLLSENTRFSYQQMVSNEFKQTTMIVDGTYNGCMIINPIFGSFPYLVETLKERPATKYKPEFQPLIQRHNQKAHKNQRVILGQPVGVVAQNYLLQKLNELERTMLTQCTLSLWEKIFKTEEYQQKLNSQDLIMDSFKFIYQIVKQNDINNSIHFVRPWKKDLQIRLNLISPLSASSSLTKCLIEAMRAFDNDLTEIMNEDSRPTPGEPSI